MTTIPIILSSLSEDCAMQFDTARFGRVTCDASDLLLFPEGLIGFEQLHAWLLLREGRLCWLQAIEEREVALPAASPFDFVVDYRLQLDAANCRSLEIDPREEMALLAVIGQHGSQWTLNLRAPILIRPALRLGRQVIASGEYSLQHVLPRTTHSARKSA
jgi:flagellar assembly factor FliW